MDKKIKNKQENTEWLIRRLRKEANEDMECYTKSLSENIQKIIETYWNLKEKSEKTAIQ